MYSCISAVGYAEGVAVTMCSLVPRLLISNYCVTFELDKGGSLGTRLDNVCIHASLL